MWTLDEHLASIRLEQEVGPMDYLPRRREEPLPKPQPGEEVYGTLNERVDPKTGEILIDFTPADQYR